MDSLAPWHITHYTLKEEHTSCRCGSHSVASRLWLNYTERRPGQKPTAVSRPLGFNESLYARIPVKHEVRQLHTRACSHCIWAGVAREDWTAPAAASPLPSHSNILQPSPASGHIARASTPAKPKGPAPGPKTPRTIDEILAAALRK